MIAPARRLSALLALVVATVGLTAPALAVPSPSTGAPGVVTAHISDDYPQAAPYVRYEGANRYATAVRISQAVWPYAPWQLRPDAIYLARGDVFADALAAGSFRSGQVLLVPSCGKVPAAVLEEVSRTGASEVVALGGETAVCDDVLRSAAQGMPTRRLGGSDRYSTAVAISREAFRFDDPVEELYVAAAADSPDAVAGGVLTRGPVLLVPSTGTVPRVVLDEVSRLSPGRVVALGGASAVSEKVLAQVAQGRATGRLAGRDRYETAVAIARHQFPSGGASTYLARGDVFADAIAGGSLKDGPVLLLPQTCGVVPRAVSDYLLSSRTPGLMAALGGPAAVCDDSLLASAKLASLQIAPPLLPDAVVGRSYTFQLSTSQSLGPVLWTATGLPAGLVLQRDTGLITGTPTGPGTFDLGVSAKDSAGRTSWLGMHLTVTP